VGEEQQEDGPKLGRKKARREVDVEIDEPWDHMEAVPDSV
jgi:hypothetical protein